MNPTQIVVPTAVGAIGETIQDFILDRVSGDVEKNLGQVIENALDGASVPVAALLILEEGSSTRSAYIIKSSELIGDVASEVSVDRSTEISAALSSVIGAPGDSVLLKLTVTDPDSPLKSKGWTVTGLTQNASLTGASAIPALDTIFTPLPKTFTLSGLLARIEDLAIANAVVAVFVNQQYPEVTIVISPEDGVFSEADVLSSFAAVPINVVNAQFVAAGDVTPKFGFESGAGF